MSHYHQYRASKETQAIPFFSIRVLSHYVKLLHMHVNLISAHVKVLRVHANLFYVSAQNFYHSNQLKDDKVNDTAGIKAVNNPVTMLQFNYALRLLGWALSLWPSGSRVCLVTR